MRTSDCIRGFSLLLLLASTSPCRGQVSDCERWLPKDVILFVQSDNGGRLIESVGRLAREIGLDHRSEQEKLEPGEYRPRPGVGGLGGLSIGTILPEPVMVAWPPQRHLTDFERDFLLAPGFLSMPKQIFNHHRTDEDFWQSCEGLLQGSGVFAVVDLGKEQFSSVFAIESRPDCDWFSVLSAEQQRLDGEKRVWKRVGDVDVYRIEASGLFFFSVGTTTYGTSSEQIVATLIDRIVDGNSDTSGSLVDNRLYQRVMAGQKTTGDLRIFVDCNRIHEMVTANFKRAFPREELYFWWELTNGPNPVLGLGIFADLNGPEFNAPTKLQVVRAYELPADLMTAYIDNLEPIQEEFTVNLPAGTADVAVLGGSKDDSKYYGQGLLFKSLRNTWILNYPVPGVAVTGWSNPGSTETLFVAFAWKTAAGEPDRSDPNENENGFRDAHPPETDTLATGSELKLKMQVGGRLEGELIVDDTRYVIWASPKSLVRKLAGEFVEPVQKNQCPIDLQVINERIRKDDTDKLIIAEGYCARTLPWYEFLGLKTSKNGVFLSYPDELLNDVPRMLVGGQYPDDAWDFDQTTTGEPATKAQFIAAHGFEDFDWLSDFWFRLRYQVFLHSVDPTMADGTVIYLYSYRTESPGVLRTEIEIHPRKNESEKGE